MVDAQNIETVLEPILVHYKQRRRQGESFGDFVARVGFQALRDYAAGYVTPAEEAALPKVAVPQALIDGLQKVAEKQGKSLTHVTTIAIEQYLATHK